MIKTALMNSFLKADLSQKPYTHWILSDVLPDEVAREFADFPIHTPEEVNYDIGTRASNNAIRGHFGPSRLAICPLCVDLATAFQDEDVVKTIEKVCDVDLSGTYLRIEYAQDRDGFWLEPHTDLGVKKFTMLIYLSDDEGSEKWGTSIYSDKDNFVYDSPYACNLALVFVPSDDTWHGYEPRKMEGVRKSLIVNYVTDEWRSREELSFPNQPI